MAKEPSPMHLEVYITVIGRMGPWMGMVLIAMKMVIPMKGILKWVRCMDTALTFLIMAMSIMESG